MTGLGIGLGFLTGFGFGAPALVVWCGIAILVRFRSNVGIVPILAVVLAAGGGVLLASHETSSPSGAPSTGGFDGELRVVEGPFLTQSGQRFTAAPVDSPGGLLCVYAGSAPQPNAGDRIVATGRVTSLSDLSQIGRSASLARACTAQLRLESLAIVENGHGLRATLSRVRVELSRFLMSAAPGDPGALLSGLVTGDDGALSTEASSAFLSSGTTHITAISGANFAMIALLLGVLGTGSMRRSLGFVIAASIVIWGFALMVGLQPSAFRAALLATAVLIGRWIGRQPDLLTLTLLLGALQIALRPSDFQTLAFQLSLAAMIALVVVFDGRQRDGQGSWTGTLLLSVVAAQLATLPILAERIGTVSGIGLLANLIVGPLAALAFPLALMGALIGQMNILLGNAALAPAIVLANSMLSVVSWSDRHLPGSMQLGEPKLGAMAILTFTAWTAIFWMSGDLRRMARYCANRVRGW